jgi:hypothetical protein
MLKDEKKTCQLKKKNLSQTHDTSYETKLTTYKANHNKL